MEKFSKKSLVSLGEYYVYSLILEIEKYSILEGGLGIEFLNMKEKVREVPRVRN